MMRFRAIVGAEEAPAGEHMGQPLPQGGNQIKEMTMMMMTIKKIRKRKKRKIKMSL